MGATVAVFGLLRDVVLAPLPYPEGDRLVVLDHAAPGVSATSSYGVARGLAREYAALGSVEALALYQGGLELTLIASGEPERVVAMRVTPSFGSVFGVLPTYGRWFGQGDSDRDAPRVAVLSDGLASRLFGRPQDALGREIRLDGVPHHVVGVTAPDLIPPEPNVHVLIPFPYHAPDRIGPFGVRGVARVRPGVTAASLTQAMNDVIASLPSRFPDDPVALRNIKQAQVTGTVVALRTHIYGRFVETLWLLTAAMALVLLTACMNVTTLFLVRGDAFRQDRAVRRALGATRFGAAAGPLWEAITLCSAGGALGLTSAVLFQHWLLQLVPPELEQMATIRLTDDVMAACVLALSMGIGVAIGVVILRGDQESTAVLQGRREVTNAGRMMFRQVMVAIQVGIGVVLLAVGLLLWQSFDRLTGIDAGFEDSSRLTFGLAVPRNRYQGGAAATFHEEFLEQVRSMPGVGKATVVTTLPLDGEGMRGSFEVRGREAAGDIRPLVMIRTAGAGYADVLGIPLLEGRDLASSDMQRGDAALVNRAFANAYLGSESALGLQIRRFGSLSDWSTVVGVIGNTVTVGLDEGPARPQVIVPLRNTTEAATLATAYYVLVGEDAVDYIGAVRQLRDARDREVAVFRPRWLGEMLVRSTARMAFASVLMTVASVAGPVLGAIGIYGLIAYVAALKRREIALRVALGATKGTVCWLVVRQTAVAVCAGTSLGMVGAACVGWSIQSQLFGVRWYEPMTYVAVGLGFLVVATAAGIGPVTRAAAASPVTSLQ